MMMNADNSHDSCTWYFTMVVLDSTLGLLTVYWLLRGLSFLVSKHRVTILYSGEYGIPPRYKPWLAQMFAYNCVMLVEKLLVSLVLLIPFVQAAGRAVLTPIGEASATFELIISLLITPFVINVLWFWIVDNFLKKAETYHHGMDRRKSSTSSLPTGSAFEMFDPLLDEDGSSEDEVIIRPYSNFAADTLSPVRSSRIRTTSS